LFAVFDSRNLTGDGFVPRNPDEMRKYGDICFFLEFSVAISLSIYLAGRLDSPRSTYPIILYTKMGSRVYIVDVESNFED